MGGVEGSLVEEVDRDDPRWAEVSTLVHERMKHSRKYGFVMQMSKLYSVKPCEVLREHKEKASKLGAPMLLFHGTVPSSAESIVRDGFQLPTWSGMFGRGIYFAKDPLKSVNYSKSDWKLVHAYRHMRSTLCSGGVPVGADRQMLLCDVYLGKTRKAQH